MKRTYILLLIGVVVICGVLAAVTLQSREQGGGAPIGGQRDERGCLGPAGYAYDEEVGACIRAFEMTPDIKRAAALAVEKVGRSYALTVVSFNSYEEVGAYDITLEQGIDRTRVVVYIKNWQVASVGSSTPTI